jgi:poly(3-hydroxybutyrate) depolymerase
VDASVTLSKGELINHVTQGGSRQYSLFKPSNPTHEKRPLVIWFHGAGGTVWPGIKDDPKRAAS